LTSESFETMFNHYDADGNGSISGEELEVFLKDVALSISDDIANNPAELHRFKSMLLKTCDESGDGILQKEEIKLWLGVE
jgi:Ca2+-binding EF-hand superfamily protein